ncbi:conserved hypothetical protein [Burkholderia sp. 8Y]|uniref:hypothetical protein n=1 Tax=Burkholderia sp. 8Y TaxID=2653133 RepID=UPI0012EF7265|nr:hypothetical protein [Burkholderia sp. 8Y]VXC78115.1 conserved hypothetical protein [Burkholderia sp. 8Y]
MTSDAHLFFTPIDEHGDIRQGDVICKKGSDGLDGFEYGLIANADCDLAQRKNGNSFTWLRIIGLNQYYDECWAPEKAAKLLEKQAKGVLSAVNAQINRLDGSLRSLDEERLFSWIIGYGLESVLAALVSSEHPVTEDIKVKLQAVDLLLEREGRKVGLQQVMEAAHLFKHSVDTMKSDMEKAFSNAGGFPDYFVLPELPLTAGIGFVVLLRAMSVVSADDVYKTELEARLADAPDAFYRIGRLSDRVRYGIMQKLGFLFMRIGDHPQYESACKTSYGIVIDDIIGAK